MHVQQNTDTEWIDDPSSYEGDKQDGDKQDVSLGRVVLPAAAVGAVVSGLTAPV